MSRPLYPPFAMSELFYSASSSSTTFRRPSLPVVLLSTSAFDIAQSHVIFFFYIALSPIHVSPGRFLSRTWRSPRYSSTCWLPFSTLKHISNASSGQPIKVRSYASGCENDASVRRILQIMSRKLHSPSLCPSPLRRDETKWACSA